MAARQDNGADASALTIGVFATCLMDALRPGVGLATARLLADLGCTVVVPKQTCCGQIAYNHGDIMGARRIASRVMASFTPFDYVVSPSGSCASMLRNHFPALFHDDPHRLARVETFSSRCFELTSFLVDVLKVRTLEARFDGRVCYHDSCAGLRELGIRRQPRELLQLVQGLELVEMETGETCCGFGGLFSMKFPEVSCAIGEKKLHLAEATGASLMLGGDLGCLMHMAGVAKRMGSRMRFRHVAEVLAEQMSSPPIGERHSLSSEGKPRGSLVQEPEAES